MENKELIESTPQETPVNWMFKPNAKTEIGFEDYLILSKTLSIFELSIAKLHNIRDKFIAEEQLLPVYLSDYDDVEKDGKVEKSFNEGKWMKKHALLVEEPKKSNAIKPEDIKLQKV